MESLRIAQTLLFECYASQSVGRERIPLVFLLGSPRTGSTLVYQLIVNFFGFYYFSNFVADHFSESPIVGTALEKTLNPHKPVPYESSYGKTSGLWEPSEASAIFMNWFGGGHPSQVVSATVRKEKESHLVTTMQSIYGLMRKPIVIKNAWNCFRIADLARIFPNAHFVWIRRDIARSAISDLAARYRRGGPEVWNSATPANYIEIQKLPYWEQVVEQQYEYNKAMESDLHMHANGRFCKIWYEDICAGLEMQLDSLAGFFEGMKVAISFADLPFPQLKNSPLNLSGQLFMDWHKIQGYISIQGLRFTEHLYFGKTINETY